MEAVSPPLEAEEFLEYVWGERPSWVDLPAKVGQYWVPWHYNYDGECDTNITRRIDTCLRDSESLYFSVGQFKRKGRAYEDALPTDWLWADLDEVHPSTAAEFELLPTVAWESSPGRYQALWRLNRELLPKVQSKLNQALSYFLGADHGGWDLTQVLRLPGTRNFKYPSAPEVKLLWVHTDLAYDPKWVWQKVRHSLPIDTGTTGNGVSTGPSGEGMGRAGRGVGRVGGGGRWMPARVRALLRVPPDAVVEGERSSKLWLIECLLAEAGWGEDDILTVVEPCAWNKWGAVATGERRLRSEIRKAIHHVARKKAASQRQDERGRRDNVGHDGETGIHDEGVGGDEALGAGLSLPFNRYASFMAMEMEEPRWLVKDIWTAHSHGIFGGEPKTSKSTLSLALGLSVASGRPFLGKYPVPTPGSVLYVQEENAQWSVQDLLRKLAHFYGLLKSSGVKERKSPPGSLGKTIVELEFPTDVPMRMLNNFGFDLTQEEHQEALWSECELVKPAMVVLDPLYLMVPGVDTDRGREITPVLKWILALRNEFGCAVVINHHFGKQNVMANGQRRSGQRLLGSTLFHGWVDCALYTEAMELNRVGWVGARIEREFRSMAPQKPLEVGLFLGEPGELNIECEVRKWDLQEAIEDLVHSEPGITSTQAAESLKVTKDVVLGRCRDSAVVTVKTVRRGTGKSYQLYPVSSNGSSAEVE